MMKGRFVGTLLVLSFISSSCSYELASRTPASLVHVHDDHDPLGLENFEIPREKVKIHRYKGLMKAPPFRFIVDKVAEHGLAIFIKRLPLEKEVEKRVLSRLHSEAFAKDFVPFLLAVKDLYSASKKSSKDNFKNHITKQIDKDEFPGLEHSLFVYKEKKKKDETKEEESSGEEKEKTPLSKMIASGITIFDALILQDPNFTLKEPPRRSSGVVERVSPHIKNLLNAILAGMVPGSDAYEAVNGIANDDKRLKAATASLIDAVHLYAYKHYNMFAKRFYQKQKLEEWLKKSSEEEIVQYFKESDQKRYGVHIMVDGLQGALVESLSRGDLDNPFLKQIYKDHSEKEKFKPKYIAHNLLPDPQVDFLKYLMTEADNKKFDHPAYLPFFKKLYKEHYNSFAKQGISTTPTISVRNIPIIQTGAPVAGEGGTGLPNFHFVDRKKDRAYYFWGNDSILLEDLTKEAGMKTLADRLPNLNSLNCMATYESGFDWSFDPLVSLVVGEKSRDFGETLCLEELEKRVQNEFKVRKLKEKFLRFVDKDKDAPKRKEKILEQIAQLENETMPEYLAFYVPWPDHFAHFKGPFSDEIISPTGELNRLDFWIGRVSKIYEKAGVQSKTLYVLAGDHGLAPVKYTLNPEKIVFDSLKKEGFDIKVNKISSDEGEGPKLSDHIHPQSQKEFDVIVASTAGGNHMIDFFVDRGTQYTKQPIYKDLINYKLLSGQVLNMVDEFLKRLDDTLDYMVLREEDSSVENGAVRVIGKRNGNRVDAVIYRRGIKIFYESPTDLFEVSKKNPYATKANFKNEKELKSNLIDQCILKAKKDDVSTWCTESEWRNLTAFSPRPDSIVQLARLYDTPLAGTVNLFPATYIGYNSKVPGRHAGELFHEKDSLVAVWGTMFHPTEKIISEENGSIAVTMYEYLSGKKTTPHKDGFGYHSMFKYLEE